MHFCLRNWSDRSPLLKQRPRKRLHNLDRRRSGTLPGYPAQEPWSPHLSLLRQVQNYWKPEDPVQHGDNQLPQKRMFSTSSIVGTESTSFPFFHQWFDHFHLYSFVHQTGLPHVMVRPTNSWTSDSNLPRDVKFYPRVDGVVTMKWVYSSATGGDLTLDVTAEELRGEGW